MGLVQFVLHESVWFALHPDGLLRHLCLNALAAAGISLTLRCLLCSLFVLTQRSGDCKQKMRADGSRPPSRRRWYISRLRGPAAVFPKHLMRRRRAGKRPRTFLLDPSCKPSCCASGVLNSAKSSAARFSTSQHQARSAVL